MTSFPSKNNSKNIGTTTLLSLVVSLSWVIEPSFALTFDKEGKLTSGVNDSALTAQNLGRLPEQFALTTRGYIASNNTNDVDFYQFTIGGSLPLEVFFDIDRANDFRSSADLDRGLDSMLWVFDEMGTLIAFNDDNTSFDFNDPEPGSSPFGDTDSFIGALTLASGDYFAVVSSFVNEPNVLSQPGLTFEDLSISGQVINGAIPDFSFDNSNDNFSSSGRYQLQIRTQEEDVAIPESSHNVGILIFGLLGVASLTKSRLKK
ncbi:hypothetical protein cce_4797 [Crocosphaera subtropica ATCC 51142]|uniref:Peptidase C-terminal archaeal/bacterial domain-containing protein n=1 Tax=Crocosphaera subtropica (strain ATCC 51142 / BH68) TaxID=43989 RepID=B1X1Y4_CROS5|nr:DVUA0089 family protein [Crocosphaera subtropica]ACB54145.1 hypothetical protein cce_4797 [Crocosphaera subtropica ATCC 51142]